MIPFSKFPADPFSEPQDMTRGLSIGGAPVIWDKDAPDHTAFLINRAHLDVHQPGLHAVITGIGEDERGSKSRSWDTGWSMAGDINRSTNPLWGPAMMKVADAQLPPGWERMASHAAYRHASGIEISDLEIRETMAECGCSLKSVLQAKELLHARGDSHIDHLKEHLAPRSDFFSWKYAAVPHEVQAGDLVVAEPR